jgi:hypothetical protein
MTFSSKNIFTQLYYSHRMRSYVVNNRWVLISRTLSSAKYAKINPMLNMIQNNVSWNTLFQCRLIIKRSNMESNLNHPDALTN